MKGIVFFMAIMSLNHYAYTQCWKEVATTSLTSALLNEDGSIWTTGSNSDGRLGDGDTSMSNPVNAHFRTYYSRINSDTDWAHIFGGHEHFFALKSNKTLWAWGRNVYGELGLGDLTNRNIPVKVNNDTDWKWVSGGNLHTIALKNNGTLWAWGDGGFGELGLGLGVFSNIPVQVGTDTDWAYCEGGGYNSWAIKSNGTIWAWGVNSDGDLGLGYTSQIGVGVPTQMAGTDWKQFSCVGGYLLAIKLNGTLWGAGSYTSNFNGYSPTQIGTDSNWLWVKTGVSRHNNAMKIDSSVWAWGGNDYGMLGVGVPDGIYYDSLMQLNLSHIKQISTRGEYNIVLKYDNTVWAWGGNDVGQLGNGITYTPFPTQVAMQGCWPTENHEITYSPMYAILYPNPAQEIVTLKTHLKVSSNEIKIDISNMIGQKVKTILAKAVTGNYTLDLDNLISGTYIVKVVVDGEVILNDKLIVD